MESNEIAAPLVVMLFVQFLLILADYAIYLLNSIRTKQIMQWIALVFFIGLYFAWGSRTQSCLEPPSPSPSASSSEQSCGTGASNGLRLFYVFIMTYHRHQLLLSASNPNKGSFRALLLELSAVQHTRSVDHSCDGLSSNGITVGRAGTSITRRSR